MFRDAVVRRFLLDGVLAERDRGRAEIEASMRRFSEGSLGIFLARDRSDDEPVGFAGFRPLRQPPVLELLYGLSPGLLGPRLRDRDVPRDTRARLRSPRARRSRHRRRRPQRGLAARAQAVGCSPGAFGMTLHFRLARADWVGAVPREAYTHER